MAWELVLFLGSASKLPVEAANFVVDHLRQESLYARTDPSAEPRLLFTNLPL
jgi:hypothetical protein